MKKNIRTQLNRLYLTKNNLIECTIFTIVAQIKIIIIPFMSITE